MHKYKTHNELKNNNCKIKNIYLTFVYDLKILTFVCFRHIDCQIRDARR